MIFINNLNIFSSLVRDKKYKCPYCAKIFKESEQLFFHVQTSHSDEIPSGYTPRHAVYDKTHPGDHLCQICKLNKCMWNEKTGRYSTICENPSCREEARRRFKENYKKKNGKDHSINDPEIQKEMMKRRKTSGNYKFQDGTVLPYISSFEKDFLEFCDLSLNLTTKDLIECPFVFYYEYEGEKHFYLPDFYLKPYDLIIEIKADEDISHPKILAIDKEMSLVERASKFVSYAVVTDSTNEVNLKELGIANVTHAVVAIGSNLQATILTTAILNEHRVKKITWAT